MLFCSGPWAKTLGLPAIHHVPQSNWPLGKTTGLWAKQSAFGQNNRPLGKTIGLRAKQFAFGQINHRIMQMIKEKKKPHQKKNKKKTKPKTTGLRAKQSAFRQNNRPSGKTIFNHAYKKNFQKKIFSQHQKKSLINCYIKDNRQNNLENNWRIYRPSGKTTGLRAKKKSASGQIKKRKNLTKKKKKPNQKQPAFGQNNRPSGKITGLRAKPSSIMLIRKISKRKNLFTTSK